MNVPNGYYVAQSSVIKNMLQGYISASNTPCTGSFDTKEEVIKDLIKINKTKEKRYELVKQGLLPRFPIIDVVKEASRVFNKEFKGLDDLWLHLKNL